MNSTNNPVSAFWEGVGVEWGGGHLGEKVFHLGERGVGGGIWLGEKISMNSLISFYLEKFKYMKILRNPKHGPKLLFITKLLPA